MAVTEYYQNMYDCRLKPKLLRSLLNDHIPDEKHPFPSPSELSDVVSKIKTHQLLTESFHEPVDQKLLDKWKSTIDALVERLLLLVSSKMPDKCWAGICLLGVACQQCSTERFLASYTLWFQKLFSQIQPPSDSQFVKVATCASLSDILTRLSAIPNMKKDGTSLAGKLVQPVLKLLAEDGSAAVWEGAVDLSCTIVNLFPSSVYRHCDNAEAIIVSKIMSGKCTRDLLKKFAHCLALLPKARGDEDGWSLMMQKILISINDHLNDAFQGLEEVKGSEAMKLLVPPGKEPPPPLGGQLSGEAMNHAVARSEQLLLSRVSTLMLSCSMMLTNPYPVQVIIPVRSLLGLIRRVLMVDGSLSQALIQFTTVMQQADICSQLPVLHLYSLDLLIAVTKGIRSLHFEDNFKDDYEVKQGRLDVIKRLFPSTVDRIRLDNQMDMFDKSLGLFGDEMAIATRMSKQPGHECRKIHIVSATHFLGYDGQLLPNAADIVRLVTEYFRRCALPALRIKVYSVMEILLISMGVGMTPYLAQDVITNAFAELDSSSNQSSVASYHTHSKPATYAVQRPSNRKRKHATVNWSTEDDLKGDGSETNVPKGRPKTSISVQIAALQALEALLTVGAALRSESWRANVDLLLISVATNACECGWGNDEKCSSTLPGELISTWADFQLAALRALLASLLSPACVRPPYLSPGLELFRRGKLEAGTKLAGFCAYALLALEVLIHPRALPLMDSSFSKCGSFEEGLNGRFPQRIFPSVEKDNILFLIGGIGEPDPDDELYESWLGDGEDVQPPVTSKTNKEVQNSDEVCGQQVEEFLAVKLVVDKGNTDKLTGITTVEAGTLGDEVMVGSERLNVSNTFGDIATLDGGAVVTTHGLNDMDRGALLGTGTVGLSAPDEGGLVTRTTLSEKGKEVMYEDDSDSMDSLPEIIIEDPDSD